MREKREEAISERPVRTSRKRSTSEEAPADRITFIDYLRNSRGATTVAPYSPRARSGAPVATPVTWTELGPELRPDSFDLRTIPVRLSRLRSDPWKEYEGSARSLTGHETGDRFMTAA